MTSGSKEKPLRLSTAWQLGDLWGLRKGRKMSLFPLRVSKISGGNTEFRIPEDLPFLFLSFPLFLLFLFPFFPGGHRLPCCSLSCAHIYAHAFEHILDVPYSGENIGTWSPDSNPFSDNTDYKSTGRLFNLFSLSFFIHQMGMIFCRKPSPLGILMGSGPTIKLLQGLILSVCV